MADERGPRRRTVLQSVGMFGALGAMDVVSAVRGDTHAAVDDETASDVPDPAARASAAVSNTNTFVHECGSLDPLSARSDRNQLTIDTTQSQYFPTLEGGSDSKRVTRSWTTGDVDVAYQVPVTIRSLTVQFHKHGSDGWVNVYESVDEGQSWSYVDTQVDTYGAGADWIHHLIRTFSISPQATDVKLVLTGGAEPWTTQLGRVAFEYFDGNPIPAPWSGA